MDKPRTKLKDFNVIIEQKRYSLDGSKETIYMGISLDCRVFRFKSDNSINITLDTRLPDDAEYKSIHAKIRPDMIMEVSGSTSGIEHSVVNVYRVIKHKKLDPLKSYIPFHITSDENDVLYDADCIAKSIIENILSGKIESSASLVTYINDWFNIKNIYENYQTNRN